MAVEFAHHEGPLSCKLRFFCDIILGKYLIDLGRCTLVHPDCSIRNFQEIDVLRRIDVKEEEDLVGFRTDLVKINGDDFVIKPVVTALVTSVVFGLSHLGNARGGNAIGVVQAVASIGSGLFYAAVFLRSGSICVPVLMHALYDWMYFVTNPALQNGEMAGMGVTAAVIISCVVDLSMSAAGLWLIRPTVREKIEAVWQNKWDFADSDADTDVGVRQYQPKH